MVVGHWAAAYLADMATPSFAFAPLLDQLKAEIQTARLRASRAANAELLSLYWRIGRLILAQQQVQGWGAKVIDQLSAELRREFPTMKGLSMRNLKYMTCATMLRPTAGLSIRSTLRRSRAAPPTVPHLSSYSPMPTSVSST